MVPSGQSLDGQAHPKYILGAGPQFGNVQFVGLQMPRGPLSCVTGDLCVYNFSLGVNSPPQNMLTLCRVNPS